MKTIDATPKNPHAISRRDFLWLTSLSAGSLLLGCAANPVTGKSQLMLMSEEQEVNIDKQQSPHQLSSDYGTLQDQALAAYVDRTGQKLARLTHRPQMPYNFHPVNAVYVNAYAFPGGTIAATRGILLKLQNEAELAALLGHELAHVNARHTAELMSKNAITSTVVGGLAAVLGAQNTRYAGIASSIGMLGAGALLASYSRDNERQADDLGMEYMVRAGYGTNGMVGLMNMLNSMSKHQLSATQLLFTTHPMSSERYETALKTANDKYPAARDLPLHRERYMDHTAGLRAIEPAIVALQEGEGAMAQEKYDEAASLFKQALKQAPGDYAGLVMMSTCQVGLKKYAEARRYAEAAQKAYPQEARAYHLSGFAKIKTQEYESALEDFNRYEKLLPGNPNITFYKGVSYENMQQQEPAADNYYKYLQVVNQGSQAQYAYRRLVEWGYLKKQ